jgi:hypothetical protein
MKTCLCAFFLLFSLSVSAQMWNGTDTLYGNEWIDYSKTYYKIRTAQDGIYRISRQALSDAGIPVADVPAAQFRLYRFGKQEPVFTTTDGLLSDQDYIEFFGEQNRDVLDRHLFEDPDRENLNPWFSLFNDTTAYYLTWDDSGSQSLRYQSVPNDLTNVPPKETYCWFETGYTYSNALFKRLVSSEVTYSWFHGEGFGTYALDDLSINLAPAERMPAGPDARLTIRYACGLGAHRQRLTFNGTTLAEDTFGEWKIVQHALSIPSNTLLNQNAARLQSLNGPSDRFSIAGVFLRYARVFDFSNAAFTSFFLDGGNTPRYLEIQGINTSGGAPVLYDLTNNLRLQTSQQGSLVQVLLPASPLERRIWLANPVAGIRIIGKIEPVQFRNYLPEDAGYIILTNAALLKDPADNNANHVAAYADYRRSPQGGNFKVAVVDINELYEQFGYGIRFHPIAVRNFVQFVHKHWSNPRYLLVIGKGLDYDRFRNPAVQTQLADSLFFVPTYGSPGADLLLVMREKKLSEPLLSVGRLAVTKPSDIRIYLDKITEHEQLFQNAAQTLEAKAWMKRVIHNSGGLAGETALIRSYTQNMADELASNRVGADMYTYYKTSNDPIQLSSYEQMLELLNGGVSIWMIFGHSSPNAVDFDIGTPSVYANKGRYPFMMVMGCFSGLCSAPQQSIGEQFVLAPGRGAIAYMASVYFSFTDVLHAFGRRYYERLGGEDYGASVGDIMRHTVRDMSQVTYPAQVALLHQNLLQGDPAVKLHFYPGPDYVVDPGSVKFDPNPAGIEQQRLKVDFDVVNIGEHTGGELALQIDQRRPDQVVLERLSDTVQAPAFRRKLSYQLPATGSQVGFNRFLIGLDPKNTLPEQPAAAEFNNSLLDPAGIPGADVYFFADDISPVAPENYGIVRQPPVVLRASTLNTNASAMRYLFELDTLETFDSPFRKSAELFRAGGLLEWTPPIAWEDSTVYYWRVARDSLVNGQVPWRRHSFLYLPGSPAGWNQSHFGQFADGAFINLEALDSTRRLEFVSSAGFISINVAYRDRDRYPGLQNVYYEGFYGDAGFNGQGLSRGVALMVQNPNTGHILPNLPGTTYNPDPKKAKALFTFNTQDSLQRLALMHFIEQVIPPGYIVGLLALHPYHDTLGYAPRRWARDSVAFGKNLFQVLEQQGAKKVRSLIQYTQGPHPYGLIFKKGGLDFDVRDTIVFHIDSMINIRSSFQAKWSVGQFETPAIGPVKTWRALQWKRQAFDDPSDFVRLSVLGLREGLTDSLLISVQPTADTSLEFISAAVFPRLRLRYESGDTATRTATQPGWLRVLYDPLAEGALDPASFLEFYADTLQQGEPGRLSLAFKNISEAVFDSVLVRYRVENESNSGQDYFTKFRPLPSGDTLHTAFQVNTHQLNGRQLLVVDVNPGNAQPELSHFNNTAVYDFFVSRDQRNPLLEVTFDGQHILDGDIVSPKPVIILTMKDENKFLAMSDTSTFALRLESPDGSMKPLSANSPGVLFIPAGSTGLPDKNRARLEWRPEFTADGDYRLFVNGRDASGNTSGNLDYSVRFKVITRSSISHLLNYPNPFSTSTCFVYTLTGAETPAQFRIQIMTVNGRVVREINAAEFGPLHAGTHTSDFCWDGRDQFGDQLANGVYLYRVSAKKPDGTDFELFGNRATDGYFSGGFGKMVLLR